MCKRIFTNQTSEVGEVPFFKIGTIGGSPDAFISRDLFEEYRTKYSYPTEGEVMITCAGTVGKTMQFDGTDSYFQDSNIVWIHNPNRLTINDFLFYVFGKINWNKLNSTTITRIYNDDLRNLIYFAPENVAEQKKIVSLLRLIDERIATQRRLIDKLETLIKGIREHCLKNLLGEEVSLSSIAEIYQPQTISSTELLDNGFPVYGANGIIGYYHSYNHNTEQICITCRGNTCGTVNYSLAKSWITGNTMVVNTDKYNDLVYKRFLFHYLSEHNFKSIISGSGQPQIVRSPLQKLKVKLPSLDKQSQIANFLDAILHKTDLEYSELNLLQKQRQHLLQRMFI